MIDQEHAIQRQTALTQLLHWGTAALVLGLFIIGYRMTRLPNANIADIFSLYQLHKSLGISVMLLTIMRITHRMFNPPPLHEANSLTPIENRLAKLSHGLLYSFLFVVPLLGWAMVSASPYQIPTVLFDTWNWPHLPPFDAMANNQQTEAVLKTVHRVCAYSLLFFILLHVAAALRHHFVKKDAVLLRMLLRRLFPGSANKGKEPHQ